MTMVNNRQVNFWRGSQTPPTIYHIWIKDNSKMLLYDGVEWVVFLDNKEILELVNNTLKKLDEMQTQINKFIDEYGNKTVNKKPIKDNPVLDGTDILTKVSGTFITESNTLSQTAKLFDSLLTTQIIE